MDFLLVKKAKNGDEQAGEQLIRKYYTAIYQYCFLHLRDRDLAEDMTQETFTRYFEALQTYTDYGKLKNYLYRIAGNIIKNYYKKKKELPMEEMSDIPGSDMRDEEIRMDI